MKTREQTSRLFLIGAKFQGIHSDGLKFSKLSNRRSIQDAVVKAATSSAWVASDQESLDELLEGATEQSLRSGSRRHRLGRLAILERPRLESLAPAQGLFTTVAWSDRWLALPEFVQVATSPHRRNLAIGGMVDLGTKTVTIYRGDFSLIAVPLSIFKPTSLGEVPDASGFAVIDGGHAIRLGEYESTFDAILYEADPAFRKRLKTSLRETDRSFGASLRRLRIQRRFRQSDFAPEVSERTIARLESGLAPRPQGRTLRAIAKQLGVEPNAIETY
jgi:hypothetical protein